MNESKDIDCIIEEYFEKSRSGFAPDIDDFVSHYPEHADELRELLPLLNDMEELGNANSHSEDGRLPDFSSVGLRIIRQIGKGGMGIVYEAEQIALKRRVAVKTLSSLSHSANRQAQFETEAKAIARLYHPGIVQIYSSGRCGDISYYVMELLEGKSLNDCRFDDVRRIAEVGLAVAEALSYAHRCGILHRDVKPANIFLDTAGHVHVTDFGLASMLDGGADSPFHGGTLRYMSPERLDEGICTASADQYALGVTLYELILGRPLFQGKTNKEVVAKIRAGELPALECPNDLAAILRKSVSLKAEERYASLDEMAADLRNYLDGRPVQAARPSPLRRLALWLKRNPLLAASALCTSAACIAVVCSIVYGYLQTKKALRQEKANAENAALSLHKVFEFMESNPPSKSATELLYLLLPYYQQAISQNALYGRELFEAWRMIYRHARSVGDYELAADACRQFLSIKRRPDVMNEYAEILRRQGMNAAADDIQREIVSNFEGAHTSSERFYVFCAMRDLAKSCNDMELLDRGYDLLKDILEAEPDDTNYRFAYARLLLDYPQRFKERILPDLEADALAILSDLMLVDPDDAEYAIAFVECVRKSLQETEVGIDDESVLQAADASIRLIDLFPFMSDAVTESLSFCKVYMERLRRNQRQTEARRFGVKLQNLLRSNYYSKNAPDELREALLEMQLRQIRMNNNTRRPPKRMQDDAEKEPDAHDAPGQRRLPNRMSEEFEKELELYDGPKKKEYLRLYRGDSNKK